MSTKIKCITFSGGDCRTYTTPKGNAYEFYKGVSTIVKDPSDALHFLRAGNSFEAEGLKKKIMDLLEKAVKTIVKKKEVDEENPPKETGVLEPNAEELEDKDTAPIDQDTEKVDEIFTKEGIKDLNKKQQDYLIKQIKGKDAKIPRYEKDRIKLLLKLQKEGNDIQGLLNKYE